MTGLWLRAALSTLALPGVVAGVLPWLIAAENRAAAAADGGPLRLIGLVPIAVGMAGLAWCIRDFAVRGRGTLAPWDPPRELVATGLYRHVRNPMYVAVIAIVGGEAILWRSLTLALYAIVAAGAMHARIIWYEEPALARQFGESFTRYRAAVPRWIPRWTGYCTRP